MKIKPFLKWAGGKTQLLEHIILPDGDTYIEPFVGGGAVLFSVADRYKNIVINDINTDLIKTYKTIKESPLKLITLLSKYEIEYNNSLDKKQYFLDKREVFNERNSDSIIQSAHMIFLNKTCFNGLYRVNSKNKFNVNWNKKENIKIFDKENILNISKILQKVTILNGNYNETLKYVDGNTIFYFDPPYKSVTDSNFKYSKGGFNDLEQRRLAFFCRGLKYKWLLSNSDCELFYKIYDGFNIKKIEAKRNINSKGSGRGKINELLISNYE
jgi:DNA adenine methylase